MTHQSESKTTRHMYNKHNIHKSNNSQKQTPGNTTSYIIIEHDQTHIYETQIKSNHQKLNNEPTNMFYEPTQILSTHNESHVKQQGPGCGGSPSNCQNI